MKIDVNKLTAKIFLPESGNRVFPGGIQYEFIATVNRDELWETYRHYGVIELHDGIFAQSWGPYETLDEALDAAAELKAKAAEPFAG